MAWNLLVSEIGAGTTPISSIDTTGVDLLIVVQFCDSGISFSDSKSNTYTHGTFYTPNGADTYTRISYCAAPTVGTGHSWTTTQSYYRIVVLGYSGSAASPADQATGNNGSTSAASVSTGSVDPSEEDELVIAAFTAYDAITNLAIDGGFSILESHVAGGGAYNGGAASLVTGSAVNPSWSWTTSTKCSAAIQTFKLAAGGGGAVGGNWGAMWGRGRVVL